jgi:hypothetical protein
VVSTGTPQFGLGLVQVSGTGLDNAHWGLIFWAKRPRVQKKKPGNSMFHPDKMIGDKK